ncbi:MAG: MBL fold metallo-hydrolase [Acidithiobacillus ferrivorans]
MKIIRSITVGKWRINCYIISDEMARCVLIDPGEDPAVIDEEIIQHNNLQPVALLATHGHLDHVGGAKYFSEKYSIPLHIHDDDVELARSATYWAAILHTPGISNPIKFEHLNSGAIQIQGFDFEIIHTPGHTSGGVCVYLPEEDAVFTGDTLFYRTVGRCDRPGLDTGGHDMLVDSIKSRLFRVPGKTTVFPAHGRSTTIDDERNSNPYLT